MKKTALALLLALLMAAALLTSGALASDDEAGPVAKVGNVEYNTFDEAMEAVIESETTSWLDLLRDVTVESTPMDTHSRSMPLRTRMRASLQYRKGAS